MRVMSVNALEEFQSLGVGFVSHQETIDSTTPMGKMMFTIVSALAEFERSVLIERVRAGMANARANGKSVGRPKKVFRRDVALELRAAGYSWRRLSRDLGIPVSTLRQACAERPADNAPKKDGKPTRNTPAS